MAVAPHTLITIRFSHYNEKARWALDRVGIPYRERPFMPMFHIPAVAFATRGTGRADHSSTRFSTPVLVTASGDVLADSTAIAQFADRHAEPNARLFGDPEAERWAKRFDEELFVHTRRVVYHHILPATSVILEIARRNTGRWQYWLGRLTVPAIRPLMSRLMRISPASVARSLARVETVVADVEQLLSDGRPYLVGDTFSIADLNFATGLSPFLWLSESEGYGARMPAAAEVSTAFDAFVRSFRERPAGELVLRMFAAERGRRVLPAP
ncbi:MAG: glutathione S-transferase family protein [Myxococcales bacterium]|nr:glutathione S-transferase family protein [Myxococcales bacterium]